MDSIHLIGAETVASAARTMAGAASEMNTAAYNIECALQRHRDFLDDWMQRFERAMNAPPVFELTAAPIADEEIPQAAPKPCRPRGPERRKDGCPLNFTDRRTGTIRRYDDEIPF